MTSEAHLATIKNILIFFMAIVIIMIVKTLSGLLIPLAFAIFTGILLQPIIAFLEKKKWPYTISITLITLLTVGCFYLAGLIMVDTGSQIVSEKDKLLGQIENRAQSMIEQFDHLPGVDKIEVTNFTELINKVATSDFILNTSGVVAGQLGTFTWNFILATIYLVAVLGSIVRYEKYIHYLEGDDDIGQQRLVKAFVEVRDSIVSYMKVKFVTSFCTGLCFGLICWAFKIDFALFWGFFAFMLNFIPTVGSITATIPPILLGLIQIDSGGTYTFFIILLVATQFVWGNVIEPLVMGSSVALNTVTVILGLVVWGYIWGVSGMLLSVPLIVLARVILAQMPDADMIVKLMGRSQLKKVK
ncbi:MAG: AI-2E family transporter [Roseivirga sp.]|nr:AI-2E family transporter [Roseivirga sp.]